MKKISILCLLLLSVLTLLVGCKADPEAINNTPEVFADEASDVLRTSAVLTGRIMAPAKASIKEYGFLVSSSSDFTSSDTQTIKCDENLKEFSAQITDLEIGGTYFYAAYATGGLDRMTSTVRAFTTPTRSGVLLSDLRMVDEKSATFSARVADTGGGEINAVGLCWATDDTPTTYDETVITTLNSDNTFTASLTGLEAGKTYYVRAFADSDILGDGTTQTISYSRDVLEITLEEELPEPTGPASIEIWYTSTDGNIVEPNDATGFGANIVSNTYENGKGVIIFDGPVTKIGDNAFSNCSSLASITIPNSVTSIGEDAFYFCKSLSSFTIPDSVTSIEKGAFRACSLTTVTIPNSVVSIGSYAFGWCYNSLTAFYGKFASSDNRCLIIDGVLNSFAPYGLTEYTIPDGINAIGDYVFWDCRKLTNIIIPNSVTSIGVGAFQACSGLTDITIPDHALSIGEYAFSFCSGLTSITIPKEVTLIGNNAFYDCTFLANVYCTPTTPPEGDKDMFTNNATGRKIYVPNASVETYKAAAYWSDYADSIYPMEEEEPHDGPANNEIWYTSTDGNIVEPRDATGFGANIVSNTYENGQGVILFDGPVTEIGNNAFESGRIKSIEIPNSVTVIGKSAFFNSSLASITIPNNVNHIGEGAFGSCDELTAFYGKFASADNLSLIVDQTFIALSAKCGLTTFSIPDGVTSIGEWAFAGCSSLQSVIIPEGVVSIGYEAFHECKNLVSASVPKSVNNIGNFAFSFCGKLNDITIPESVSTIGDGTFWACYALEEITIPARITKIGTQAFWICSGLTNIYCMPTTPPTYGNNMFYGIASDVKIYVPNASVEAYKSAPGWSDYADYIYPMEEEEQEVPETWKIYYTSTNGAIVKPYIATGFGANIVSNTYENGQGVITFDGPVTSIGGLAFYYCSRLASITIPDSVTSIGKSAFYWCELTSVAIGSGVTLIGESAFFDCGPLTKVEISDLAAWCRIEFLNYESNPLNWWGGNLYLNGSLVTDLVIPDGVTSIGNHAFYGCTSLISVTIPDSVTSIGNHAFDGCDGLTSVTIGNGVTSIGALAFVDCESLTKVEISDVAAWCGIECVGNASNPLCYARNLYLNGSLITDLIIPDGVTSIGKYAFYNSNLTSVTIPESVTSIGEEAFYHCVGKLIVNCNIPSGTTSSEGCFYCSKFTEVIIGDGVTSIGDNAFNRCYSLTSVTIPDSVTSIGNYAFYSCDGLTSVTIPDSVTSIGSYAFSSCSSLTSVYCMPKTPPTGVAGGFDFNGTGRKIYVPNASVEAYKAASGWSDYASSIVGYDF